MVALEQSLRPPAVPAVNLLLAGSEFLGRWIGAAGVWEGTRVFGVHAVYLQSTISIFKNLVCLHGSS